MGQISVLRFVARLANFSADDFERFVPEWANGYLRTKLPGVDDVQQRGGSGTNAHLTKPVDVSAFLETIGQPPAPH